MEPNFKLRNKNILVTGGAGFIGSNLCEYLLSCEANVTCLDNFATGHMHNIEEFLGHTKFTLIEGDIRNLETCQSACKGQEFILHQAALGSVPRSLKDPITSNEVNISGFLNMLLAARDNNIKRFIFAASSSTYGDSEKLPKVEDEIGKPLSPYAVTKYVNELYADIFQNAYGLDYIGLRYFNVFGRRQDPNGAYAAVIPLFIKQLINYESPVINGDGSYSRDFTYIDNVIQMNVLAMTTKNKAAINQIYNTAVGDRTNLFELVNYLKKYLAYFDEKIKEVKVKHGPSRKGDIPHSLASIEKSQKLLLYTPSHFIENGLKESIKYYHREKK
jgi:UDP-N-acetylglucosamine/UDP-N-acetylgalactosamine 4-epimerase